MENENNDSVTISQKELSTLLNRIEKLESKNSPLKRITERTAHLRMLGDKLVIGNKGTKRYVNPDTKELETKILLILKNGEKTENKEMDILEYLNDSTIVNFKILSQKAINGEIFQGRFKPENPDPMNNKINIEETDAIVKTVEYISKIECLDEPFVGLTMEINNKFLND